MRSEKPWKSEVMAIRGCEMPQFRKSGHQLVRERTQPVLKRTSTSPEEDTKPVRRSERMWSEKIHLGVLSVRTNGTHVYMSTLLPTPSADIEIEGHCTSK
ncbi:hypothetical protein CAEBREN_24614 [Caenorhabditis brenneri]|uniref:Uncharacterized protein n=1 Tax=Caenorhabditis brenneri TaxID=135651 RepID=G0NJ41_CAEBE|nr:hypothetical protein CAEBREN_24614 [Caenorhabditis brenneri]